MKVAVVSPAFPGKRRGFYPGIERVTEGIAKGLSSNGAEVRVICSMRNGGPAYETLRSGTEVARVRSLLDYPGSGFLASGLLAFSATVYKSCLNQIRQCDIIQIISQGFVPARCIIGRRPLILSYFPHFDTPRTLSEFMYLPFVNRIADAIFKRSDAVVAGIPPESQESKSFLLRFGLSPRKIRYVHEGFDPESFTSVIENKIVEKYGPNMLLYVGPLVQRKGLKYLIQAMKLIAKEVPSAHLVLVGTIHRYGGDLMSLVRRLNLSGNVTFAGFVAEDRLVAYYRAAKLFVFPSLLEGYPLVVLEAMGSGTPVVATNLEPIREQLGETGVLFRKGDVNGIADSVLNLLANEGLRAQLAEAAKARVLSRFTWHMIGKEFISIYRELLKSTQ